MKTMEKLAANFNALLHIEPGHFGHAKKGPPGPGVKRARQRAKAQRAWQKTYYADTPAPKVSRQVKRRDDRLTSRLITPAEFARRKMAAIHIARRKAKGLLPVDRNANIWRKDPA